VIATSEVDLRFPGFTYERAIRFQEGYEMPEESSHWGRWPLSCHHHSSFSFSSSSVQRYPVRHQDVQVGGFVETYIWFCGFGFCFPFLCCFYCRYALLGIFVDHRDIIHRRHPGRSSKRSVVCTSSPIHVPLLPLWSVTPPLASSALLPRSLVSAVPIRTTLFL